MIEVTGEYALLRDGRQVLVRPFAPDNRADCAQVAALLERLSPESRALRFHSAGVRVTPDALDAVTRGHVLLAERGGHLVALASYVPLRDPTRAEMAILVDDAVQGRGVGTALFERLAQDAREAGITRFIAEVLLSNQGMLALLQGLGFRTTRTLAGGEVEVEVDLRPHPAYVAATDARRHVAAAASLDPLFHPRAVAVIGASRRRGTIGHELFRNLLAGGFAGPVYPVNPSAAAAGRGAAAVAGAEAGADTSAGAGAVASVRAYPSVAAIPDQIDLAIIAVPAAAVLAAAREALAAGVRGLVVISAGFAEVGAQGRQRQEELLALCRTHDARLIGPNCMGVLVNGPEGALNATFAPTLPPAGTLAVSSQSGALGIAILEHARGLGLGVSSFVSVGNKADVSSNDLLECWEDDPATRAILLYLESFGNPRRFARIARRVGARKPILAVKGGRSETGRRAAASHTAALAGAEVAVDALFRQAGVTRCETLEELFEAATLLATQPLPAGNHVAVLTNAGGLGILCADACEAHGLALPPLAAETQAALRALLPPEAAVGNPVDMLAAGSAESYGAALRLLLADPGIDAVIVLFIPPLVTAADDVAAALVAACDPVVVATSIPAGSPLPVGASRPDGARVPAKPVLTCFVGAQGTPAALRGARVIPSYTFPEAAARALGHAAARAAWLRQPAGEAPAFTGIDAPTARAVVAQALARAADAGEERPWLATSEVRAVLRAYGLSLPDEIIVHSPEDAAEACRRLGGPVALKLVSRTVLHKTDVGGVRLNLATPEEAADAYRAMQDTLAARGQAEAMEGALVQPMLTEGVECLVGVVGDPLFGPLIAFGLGGVMAEALGDVAFRVHPLTDRDADELIASVKAARLLAGYRGRPAADMPALRELLLRVAQLVEDVPEVAELDLNPVLVRAQGQGAVVLDARIRLSHASVGQPLA